MEPPTRRAPPDAGTTAARGSSPWAECIIEDCAGGEACTTLEIWVFRGEHLARFGSFLQLRGFEPAGPAQALEDPDQGADGKQVQLTSAAGTTATCRERRIDASLPCAECTRLVTGGVYGARGITVAAYPPQPNVNGCLALSRDLPDPVNEDGWSTPDSTGNWDSSPPREIAFCNTVRSRF